MSYRAVDSGGTPVLNLLPDADFDMLELDLSTNPMSISF